MIHIDGENHNKTLYFKLLLKKNMLEFSKLILKKVSFCKKLFKKELIKSIKWIKKKEVVKLKIWALATFYQFQTIILEVVNQ